MDVRRSPRGPEKSLELDGSLGLVSVVSHGLAVIYSDDKMKQAIRPRRGGR